MFVEYPSTIFPEAPSGAPYFNGEGIFATGSELLDIFGLDGLCGEGRSRAD